MAGIAVSEAHRSAYPADAEKYPPALEPYLSL